MRGHNNQCEVGKRDATTSPGLPSSAAMAGAPHSPASALAWACASRSEGRLRQRWARPHRPRGRKRNKKHAGRRLAAQLAARLGARLAVLLTVRLAQLGRVLTRRTVDPGRRPSRRYRPGSLRRPAWTGRASPERSHRAPKPASRRACAHGDACPGWDAGRGRAPGRLYACFVRAARPSVHEADSASRTPACEAGLGT